MGIWLTYCSLCGGPPELDYDIRIRGTSWLKIIGGILPSDKYAFGKYDATGVIDVGSYTINVEPIAFDDYGKPVKKGFLVHKECYNFAKNIKNLHAKLSSFNRVRGISGYLSGLNYAPLQKYAGQFFDWEKFKSNSKDHYALENPKYNEKNRKRIMENIKKVDKKAIKPQKEDKNPREMRKKGYSLSRRTGKWEKIKSRSPSKRRKSKSRSLSKRRSRSPSKRKRSRRLSKSNKAKRKSPIESATSYAVGTKKIGLDGNVWKIKKNIRGIKRWVKL